MKKQNKSKLKKAQSKRYQQNKLNKKRNSIKFWVISGVIILVWTIFWFIQVRIFNHYEFVINVMLLFIGNCLLILHLLITAIYFAIKILKKEHKI